MLKTIEELKQKIDIVEKKKELEQKICSCIHIQKKIS